VFKVSVSDGENVVALEHTVTITWLAQEIVANVVTDVSVQNSVAIMQFDPTSSVDPDGYALTYSWTQKFVTVSDVELNLSGVSSDGVLSILLPEVEKITYVGVTLTVYAGTRITTKDVMFNIAPSTNDDDGGSGTMGWLVLLLAFAQYKRTPKCSQL
jgi:hypothetical protein